MKMFLLAVELLSDEQRKPFFKKRETDTRALFNPTDGHTLTDGQKYPKQLFSETLESILDDNHWITQGLDNPADWVQLANWGSVSVQANNPRRLQITFCNQS